jgi:XTP/dITP diphosphohydrolase
MRIYVATSNAGKLRDFAYAAEGRLAGGEAVTIEPLPGLAGIVAPPEDEPTFEGNARVKARYYSEYAAGELVLADDSGLEVTCLEGAPGVRSARYAEDMNFPGHESAPAAGNIDERNNAALLRALDGVPDNYRQGRYRCVLAVARDGEVVAVAEGAVEGSILTGPRGEGGFGYDPLFRVTELGRTMAELDAGTRLGVSHRGRALGELLRVLRT